MSEPIADLWHRLTIPGHIVWMDVEADLLLYNSENGDYSLLNEAASAIWRGIAAGSALAPFLVQLAEEFEAAPEAIEQDLSHFVTQALSKGFLSEGNGGPE